MTWIKKGFLAALLLPFAAYAQPQEIVTQFSIGTGFFVNKKGYLLTSAHVIAPCKKYVVYGDDSVMQATLVARDEDLDLVLLRATFPVEEIGEFYDPETPPDIGSALTTIGYPSDTWKKHIPKIGTAKLLAMEGPQGEESLLQFTDSVQQGNSGGPLLDSSGHVVGIVAAKVTITATSALTQEVLSVRNVGVAVGAGAVKRFLEESGLDFPVAESRVKLGRSQIAEHAKAFVVNVRCKVD